MSQKFNLEPLFVLGATDGEQMSFVICLTDPGTLPLFSSTVMRVRLPDGSIVQASGASLGEGGYLYTFPVDTIPCGEHRANIRFFDAAGVPILTFPDAECQALAVRVQGDLQ